MEKIDKVSYDPLSIFYFFLFIGEINLKFPKADLKLVSTIILLQDSVKK